MKLSKKIFIFISLLILIIAPVYVLATLTTPKEVYRVYLKGKTIGYIKSKKELENYINNEQEKLKKRYKVDAVYIPEDVNIEKEITYYNKIDSVENIYKKISKLSSFTIDGYEISISGTKTLTGNNELVEIKPQKIYVLKKKVFKDAVNLLVKSFINEKEYDNFSNNTQPEILDTGKKINKIYLENKVKIKKDKISVNNTIYEDANVLGKYLLFGTTSDGETYTVKDGDTVEDIAFNHKLSTNEFLVANPKLKSSNVLLSPGQELKVATLKPQINVVEESTVVEKREEPYQTETKYDDNEYTTFQKVETPGVKGMAKVTKIVQNINGVQVNGKETSKEILKTAVNEVIIKGTKKRSSYGYGAPIPTAGSWGWPATCTNISSPFGYRWGTLHDGTDIAGCGYNSNIFAAQAGTVEVSKKKKGGYKGGYGDNGEYIIINHHNGYYTIYAHLCPGCRYVKEGDEVVKGQVIGGMGDTGAATAIHLHFGMFVGGLPYYGGRPINAMRAY